MKKVDLKKPNSNKTASVKPNSKSAKTGKQYMKSGRRKG
jgi:hypothetical protein